MTATTIRIMMSGLPGRMAALVAARAATTEGLELADAAWSGPAHAGQSLELQVGGVSRLIALLGPPSSEACERAFVAGESGGAAATIVIDYSAPATSTGNAIAFAAAGVPFVMGTTGVDRAAVAAAVADAGIAAVVAPNMAIPIVVLGAALRWAAAHFPGALSDLDLAIAESHQAAKRDVSGTALALLGPLSDLIAAPPEPARIESIRDADEQRALGIPEEHLDGHAFHRYTMASEHGDTQLDLRHTILGRAAYVDGTLRAARFLAAEVARRRAAAAWRRPGTGRVYGMEDVLAAAADSPADSSASSS